MQQCNRMRWHNCLLLWDPWTGAIARGCPLAVALKLVAMGSPTPCALQQQALEDAFARSPTGFAAVIVEPIQGEGGINPAPPGYLQAVQSLCRKHGTLFIVDEIQTGLGRTGHMLAHQALGLQPDIVTLGKALGGGLVPLSAMLCTEKAWVPGVGPMLSRGVVSSGCCRVGIWALRELQRDNQRHIRNAATVCAVSTCACHACLDAWA